MSELIDVYEWKGEALVHTGVMDKLEAEHKGVWHKVARFQLIKKIEDEYYIILQRRGRHKKLGALKFSVAVSEHIMAGESDLDACIRGIKEELGTNVGKRELKEAYNIKFQFDRGSIKERTYCKTYILEYANEIENFILQKEEVEGIYTIKINNIMEMFEEKVDKIEAIGIRLSEDETGYIDDVAIIDKDSFTDYDFYKEDFLKIKEYIDCNLTKLY